MDSNTSEYLYDIILTRFNVPDLLTEIIGIMDKFKQDSLSKEKYTKEFSDQLNKTHASYMESEPNFEKLIKDRNSQNVKSR